MYKAFTRYFFHYLIHSKTRQRLLFVAIVGLFLSSFSLLVLQSTMGGLQQKLVRRSKAVTGHGTIYFKKLTPTKALKIIKKLNEQGINAQQELVLEVLLRQGSFLAPAIIHGVEELPEIIKKNLKEYYSPKDLKLKEIFLGQDLAYLLKAHEGSAIDLISPSYVDDIFGEVPRQITTYLQGSMLTNVVEVDNSYGWIKYSILQNITRSNFINQITLYNTFNLTQVKKIVTNVTNQKFSIKTWTDLNQPLAWSLKLETTVMVFLFVCMTFLVSLSITSGLMVFFGKVKKDLVSFWILGASKAQIKRANIIFLFKMSLYTVLGGLLFASLCLFLLDQYGGEIMPEIFVDRKIPVYYSIRAFVISFFVPFLISLFFSALTLHNFQKETDYLDYVRSVGL